MIQGLNIYYIFENILIIVKIANEKNKMALI